VLGSRGNGRCWTKTALVLGGGGFIGTQLTARLKDEGAWVRCVDVHEPEFGETCADEFVLADLRDPTLCREVVDRPFDATYQLAANMGGAGFIFTGTNDVAIMCDSAQINLNVVRACRSAGISRLLFTSSACVYPDRLQRDPQRPDCAEQRVYPASPDSEYGWEKLFAERLYGAWARTGEARVKIARLHNVFGPGATWRGGREKAPAAICRKVAEATDGEVIEVWGDGEQTRSFLYVTECVDGLCRLMASDFDGPVNLGSDEMVTIADLARMIIDVSGKRLDVRFVDGPQGVRGRRSDNRLIEARLGWRPTLALREGVERTYRWVEQQVAVAAA
jgi:nucleoside-diphosphate-sugar epimerase